MLAKLTPISDYKVSGLGMMNHQSIGALRLKMQQRSGRIEPGEGGAADRSDGREVGAGNVVLPGKIIQARECLVAPVEDNSAFLLTILVAQ